MGFSILTQGNAAKGLYYKTIFIAYLGSVNLSTTTREIHYPEVARHFHR